MRNIPRLELIPIGKQGKCLTARFPFVIFIQLGLIWYRLVNNKLHLLHIFYLIILPNPNSITLLSNLSVWDFFLPQTIPREIFTLKIMKCQLLDIWLLEAAWHSTVGLATPQSDSRQSLVGVFGGRLEFSNE